ncbi:hypothetical protein S7335_1186 [Synechococcus sp. PCC 7335]|uniref:DUF932 domain-containing protein n=1 Tax=Synechococcus sp. (strain ATCC 29403 / PCC 7335) TaxID=91464 RepID=UPI00017EB1D0|nr:DUF932 domain-containing protein [Synechococcus sp. PCC 7335]EDX82482.1 hypothetical protein S7335_1186 [Synechococcus sp. PCC 7335]
MKSGRTLTEMAQALEAQQTQKKDFVADTRALEMTPNGQLAIVNAETTQQFAITPHAHRQIGDRIGIPAKYYDRMRVEAPQLLQSNVNHWFQEQPEQRMIRTMGTDARAFLSRRYRRLDNFDLADAVLPTLLEMQGARVVSCELTETRMYLKVVTDRIQADVKVGDAVQAGVCISNSEIGMGSLRVEPLIYRLVCTNGMVSPDRSARNRFTHLGRAAADTPDAYELFSDKTLEADNTAFFLKVQDLVRDAVDRTKFEHLVAQMRDTTERRIEGNPVKTVEVLTNKFKLQQNESSGVLQHLIRGGDLSQWGLLNAVTRTAQDAESYDRATELEELGSTVMTLPANQWKQLATVS